MTASASFRTVRSLGIIALIGGALSVAMTSSARAAGTGLPDVRFCLAYQNGTPYASKPATLYRWSGSAWATYRKGSTNATGCGTFIDVQPNSYYKVGGYWQYSPDGGRTGYFYSGYTAYGAILNAYDGVYWLGTGSVAGPSRLY